MTKNKIKINIGSISFNMIFVEGGSLEIGATNEQSQYAENNEHPAHVITLSDFYISEYPITQNIWEYVMGYNKSKFKAQYNDRNNAKGNLPVERISHDEALEFTNKLSLLTNMYFCLPSEDEWEYAARGGQKTKHCIFAGSNNIDEVAWYKNNSNASTHPVGEKKPNELGLYDMCGNIWEWTETPAYSYFLKKDDWGETFIRRGGSWYHDSKNCRVSFRYASDHNKKTSGLGLRVVIRNKKRRPLNNTIKIFIAGAKRLKIKRALIKDEICKVENEMNLDIRTLTFEDFPTSLTGMQGGRQNDYDGFIQDEANIAIFLFASTAGEITEKEFSLAYESLQKYGHPDIFVYACKTKNILNETNIRLSNIKKIFEGSNPEYFIEYNDNNDLRYHVYRDLIQYFRRNNS